MRELSILLLLATITTSAHAQSPADFERTGINALNRALHDATRRMDNSATLALWADDGISLLPATPPIVGKKAISQFLDNVMASIPGAHMESFESQCFDIEISGDWASEWCTEHQIVQLAGGKPPFDGRGKMLLVLHRESDGRWRIKREMWNEAAAEAAPSPPRSQPNNLTDTGRQFRREQEASRT